MNVGVDAAWVSSLGRGYHGWFGRKRLALFCFLGLTQGTIRTLGREGTTRSATFAFLELQLMTEPLQSKPGT